MEWKQAAAYHARRGQVETSLLLVKELIQIVWDYEGTTLAEPGLVVLAQDELEAWLPGVLLLNTKGELIVHFIGYKSSFNRNFCGSEVDTKWTHDKRGPCRISTWQNLMCIFGCFLFSSVSLDKPLRRMVWNSTQVETVETWLHENWARSGNGMWNHFSTCPHLPCPSSLDDEDLHWIQSLLPSLSFLFLSQITTKSFQDLVPDAK